MKRDRNTRGRRMGHFIRPTRITAVLFQEHLESSGYVCSQRRLPGIVGPVGRISDKGK